MTTKHQVLLLWDLGEGANLYALTVNAKEFKELMAINDLYCNSDLPEELEPEWDRVHAALSDDPEHVADHAKGCVGKWTRCKLKPGEMVTLDGNWTVVSSGMAL